MQLSRSFGPVRSLLPRFLVVHELLPRERELICVGNCVSCDRGKVLSQNVKIYRGVPVCPFSPGCGPNPELFLPVWKFKVQSNNTFR